MFDPSGRPDRSKKKRTNRVSAYVVLSAAAVITLAAIIAMLIGFIRSGSEMQGTHSPAASYPKVIYIPEPTASPDMPAAETTPAPQNSETILLLNAVSSEEDLFISLRDEYYDIIADEQFIFEITYPNNSTESFYSDRDGECYVSGLTAGDYVVSVQHKQGFSDTAPLTVSVNRALNAHTSAMFPKWQKSLNRRK